MGFQNKEDIPQDATPLLTRYKELIEIKIISRTQWRSARSEIKNVTDTKRLKVLNEKIDNLKRIYDRAVLAVESFKELYPEVTI